MQPHVSFNKPLTPDLYLCHACGQIHSIKSHNDLNDAPIMHCPACGAPSLAPTGNSFDAYFADCFKHMGVRMIDLMKNEWVLNATGERTFFPSLISYIMWRVNLTEDTGCVCCSVTGG